MRRGTAERALQVLFDIDSVSLLQAVVPLGDTDMLRSKSFEVPFSFIFADDDIVSHFDNGSCRELIAERRGSSPG